MSKTIVFQNPEGKIARYRAEEVGDMMARSQQDFKYIPTAEEAREVNKYAYRPIGEE